MLIIFQYFYTLLKEWYTHINISVFCDLDVFVISMVWVILVTPTTCV